MVETIITFTEEQYAALQRLTEAQNTTVEHLLQQWAQQYTEQTLTEKSRWVIPPLPPQMRPSLQSIAGKYHALEGPSAGHDDAFDDAGDAGI